MAQEYQYFYEDEVYKYNKKGNLELGMVLENAEFVSSDEESDGDDDDKVTKGSIRVAWYPKGEEQVLLERKVGLADRSLMPGDVVRRLIRGKDTQRGYCRQVHVTSSVQVVGTKHIILSVDSNDLTPLEEFTADIAVALDSWVGMVNMVKCRIVMVTADGSRCVLSDHLALELDDIRDTRDRDSEFRRYDFYPGQQLVGPVRVYEYAEWLQKSPEITNLLTKHNKTLKVTVELVQVVQLGVRWQCRAFSNDPNSDKEQPKYIVQGEDLKRVRMLNVFEPCTLQLGDRNYYTLRDGDVVLTKEQWRKLMANQLLTCGANNPSCPLFRPKPPKHKSKTDCTHSSNTIEVVGKNRMQVDISPQAAVARKPDLSPIEICVDKPAADLPSPDKDLVTDSDGFVDVDTDDFSDTASISSGTSAGSCGRRNKKGPALMTKLLKKRKLKRAKRKTAGADCVVLKTGDRLVVETLMTTSKANVVWQDGSVEDCIASTVLYPIHHLDDQEFFPGDFVVEQKDAIDAHEYGVVQRVDHGGRTAIVKWFRTYTAGSEPRPLFTNQQEVSVYDLRDHPDFRYRPGSVVIRVANFENNQICSTGQVLDNFPTGEVSVWWVDGSTSVCYPQDLYKVGEYDSDDGELWDDSASDQSWETESEHSVIAEEVETENDTTLKIRLLANIEKARIAMSRLEEIFTQNPSLQTTAVMKQLLDCYKECRYMDKLMGTSFFHESNFQGLIEKVRERGRASTNQRMTEQFNRLFSTTKEVDTNGATVDGDIDSKDDDVLPSLSPLPSSPLINRDVLNIHNDSDQNNVNIESEYINQIKNLNNEVTNNDKTTTVVSVSTNILNNQQDYVIDEETHKCSNKKIIVSKDNKLLSNKSLKDDSMSENQTNSEILNSSANLSENLANLSISSSGVLCGKINKQDGLVRGRGPAESLRHKRMSETDMLSSSDKICDSKLKDSKSCNDIKIDYGDCDGDGDGEIVGSGASVSEEIRTSHMCAQLCSLMKAQLLKTYEEVVCRYGGHFDMSRMLACHDGDLYMPDGESTHGENKENIIGGVGENLNNDGGNNFKPEESKLRSSSIPKNRLAAELAKCINSVVESKLINNAKANFNNDSVVNNNSGSSEGVNTTNDNNALSLKENSTTISTDSSDICAPTISDNTTTTTVSTDCNSTISADSTTITTDNIVNIDTVKFESTITGEDDVSSPSEGFQVLEAAPDCHKFKLTMFQPTDPPNFYRTVRKEMKLLKTSLPSGIWVRGYEDRMDLYSVMIQGPERTPYEDGLFFFDFQLSADYPRAPPLCHYVTYVSDKLNPNLYEDGKVCVSLLGTWNGKGTEVWTSQSNLLQVIISIQGLILVSEPYFNEAGYERQKGTQQGRENSRMYNEMVVLKLIQAVSKLITSPPEIFRDEIVRHFHDKAYKLVYRLKHWLEISEVHNSNHPLSPTTPNTFRDLQTLELKVDLPEFPLIPASKGFCITLGKTLLSFQDVLGSVGIQHPPVSEVNVIRDTTVETNTIKNT